MKRPLPLNHIGGILKTVHRDIRDSVYRFHSEMVRFESQIPKGIFQPGPVTPEALPFLEAKSHSAMYSRVAQVFAFLAVEAFVNDYGYLRLGEDAFEQKFRNKPIPISRKLTSILQEVIEDIGGNAEIDQVLKRLADRRNSLVHPKPEMTVLLEDGTIRETTKRLPRVDPTPATTAVEEMDRFFELITAIDPEAAFVLGVQPSRPPSSGDSRNRRT